MGAPAPVEPARIDAKDYTITYARGAALTEWYVNDEKGLKSWYRFDKAPVGDAPCPAELELRAIRGEAALQAALALRDEQGFAPHVMLAHAGLGDSLS